MRRTGTEPVRILLAEDDDDDFLLTQQALKEIHVLNTLDRVVDGVELMDFLRRRGPFAARRQPHPALILLDLNMPRKDGREALREIKSDPALRKLPVVVLTTSRAEEDVVRSYELGVNSFISKPVTFPGLVSAMKVLGDYWFEIVELPRSE
jgi:CheY-like chemotaxis protein